MSEDPAPTTGPVTDEQPRFSRRQVLVFGAAGTALLMSAYGGLRQVGRYPAMPAGFKQLTPKSYAIYQAVGDFYLPPGGPLPGSGGDDETLLRVDSFINGMPESKAKLAAALPLVLEHGSGLDRFGARSMTALPAAKQAAYLRSWAEASDPIRATLWMTVRAFFAFSYPERPDVMAAMDWPVPCGGSAS